MKRLISLILAILLICTFLSGCFKPEKASIINSDIDRENSGLIVHFIDIGQGDSILLESKGEFALIDGGEYSEREIVVSYLSSQGVEDLNFIISTHPHSDHCGSLSEVIRNFDTETLICPDVDNDTPSWDYVLDAADERGVSYTTPEPYDTYKLGDATITILSPSSDAVYSNLNDYSIVCKAEYGNTSFMLTGDAEKLIEKQLIRDGFDLSADVLKCGHHGSSTSSCSEFLDAVNPSAAIISCGKNNDYGHPHRETVSELKSRNIPYWRTDTDGTIVAASDGEDIYISTSSQSPVSVTQATASENARYIGNKNSKVFHFSECAGVKDMSDKNKVNFYSRDEAASKGYKPCKSCTP
ncbi:MAG: MBL fold metallo-hydrolase [Ruminococcus sp.]|nr:MBL fold metallo-hydrolase [Ruminococcus sp.]